MPLVGYSIERTYNVTNRQLGKVSFEMRIIVLGPRSLFEGIHNWEKLGTTLERVLVENNWSTLTPNIHGKINMDPQVVLEYKVISNTRKIKCVVKRIDGATST